MSVQPVSNAHAYVKGLDVGSPHRLPAALPMLKSPAPDLKGDGASVAAGSVLSFTAGLNAQQRADVLHSTLLAQLAADKRYDRATEVEAWYRFYTEVLSQVGWVGDGFAFKTIEATGNTVRVDAQVLGALAAIASGNEVAAVKATLKALEGIAGSDHRFVFFARDSRTGTSANFQIGVASAAGGAVAMRLGAFVVKAKTVSDRFLWFDYSSSDVSLQAATQPITLDESIYGGVRQAIVTKLAEHAGNYVSNLSI